MRKFKQCRLLTCFILSLPLLFFSCTVEKRVHMQGYHIKRNAQHEAKLVRVEQKENVQKTNPNLNKAVSYAALEVVRHGTGIEDIAVQKEQTVDNFKGGKSESEWGSKNILISAEESAVTNNSEARVAQNQLEIASEPRKEIIVEQKHLVESEYSGHGSESNQMSAAAFLGFIFSILSIISLVSMFFLLSILLGVAAMILCSAGKRNCMQKGKSGLKLAKAGFIIGLIGVILGILTTIFVLLFYLTFVGGI